MRLIIISIILILFTGCNLNQTSSSDYGQSMYSIFNEDEITELDKIYNFFTTHICNGSNHSIEQCYLLFMERIYLQRESGEINVNIPFDLQDSLFAQIDSNLFYQIWTFHHPIRPIEAQHLEFIELNIDGKILPYMKLLSEEYDIFKVFYDDFQAAHDLSPTSIADLIIQYKRFQLNDKKVRLIIAIFYLTINQYNKESEEFEKIRRTTPAHRQ
jgi:hypothetical protein